ncbi:MAG: SAM domain-containing protein [Burkholderiales bacterium]
MASDSSHEEMRQRFAQWLREAGLERYTGVFAENDIDFGNAGTLSEADLKELGFTLGHRKNFLAAVQALPGAATPAVVAHEPITKLPAVETGGLG